MVIIKENAKINNKTEKIKLNLNKKSFKNLLAKEVNIK